jgi:hypothetical protein
MKKVALSCCLAAFVCGITGGCAAQVPAEGQAGSAQAGDTQSPNQPINSGMTCAEFKALLKSGDKRTSGLAILWLDGFYSGRAGLSELPAGWTRTVGQGIGGTCAISVNDHRTVLDVIGQLHREYSGQR